MILGNDGAGSLSVLEEDARVGVKDKRPFGLDRRTEFGQTYGCCRRDLEGRRGNQGSKLRIEAQLRGLIDQGKWRNRKMVHHLPGRGANQCEYRHTDEVANDCPDDIFPLSPATRFVPV